MQAGELQATINIKAEDVRDHYNDLDQYYREIWGDHVHHGLFANSKTSSEKAVIALLDLVAKEAGFQKGSQYCDIGCGYGASARYFADQFASEVSGITLSDRQYSYAQTVTPPSQGKVNYQLGDFLQNDFSDSQFDFAYAVECLAHVTDKEKAISEIHRTLKPGGTFATCVWLSCQNPSNLQKKYILTPICDEGRLPSLPTKTLYEDLLKKHSFRNIRYIDLTSQVHRTWLIVMKRAMVGILKNSEYRKFIFNSANDNRIFLLSLPRLWLGLRLHTLQYGLLLAEKKR